MKTPCAMCDQAGQVYMRTDLSNPDCDNEDLTTCPRCGGSGFLEAGIKRRVTTPQHSTEEQGR